MTELNSKQESFISMMKESEELERYGFELLKSRKDLVSFFDGLVNAGLLDADRNPAPIETSDGYYQVPYWSALDYLRAVAALSGEQNDTELANKVMNVLREVSNLYDQKPELQDNFHTPRVLAEILGVVPLEVITDDDIHLISKWLRGQFDRGLIGDKLMRGIIPRLLATDDPENINKAILILEYCTEIKWVEEKGFEKDREKPVSLVGDYHLDRLVKANKQAFIDKAASQTADIFLKRLLKVFSDDIHTGASWSSRPAIENHSQNHDWKRVENIFVEGLRDVILGWLDQHEDEAKPFIESLLKGDAEIVRRVGISLLDQRWEALKDLYEAALDTDLFRSGHLHELYNLLRNHFQDFPSDLKEKTLAVIKKLPEPSHSNDPSCSLRRTQRNWLSAVAGKGYEPVEAWYKELSSDPELGGLSDHPDFLSYMEFSTGSGSSPYSVKELVAFCHKGNIVSKLKGFKQIDTWRGPTTRALVDILEKAVKSNPSSFIAILPEFLEAKRPFQYGIINGFKKLWDSDDNKQQFDWDHAWPELITFFEALIFDDSFWTEKVIEDENLTPSRNWIPSLISDLIQAGTKKDEKAYSADLLPRTWKLVDVLVEKSEAADEPAKNNSMNQAINTTKGRAIEALLNHALRNCRAGDEKEANHDKIWENMQPVFDRELAKCQNQNFEFSTLCAAYIVNLLYMNKDWVTENFEKIFPVSYLPNYSCALGGLAYATPTKYLYDLLLNHEVIEFSLQHDLGGENAREKLIEHMALAYLWGNDDLSSLRFSYLFENSLTGDLKIMGNFFWSVSRQDISKEQIQKILSFWERCIEWSAKQSPVPENLLSSLSSLACYLESADEKEIVLLMAVAPHVKIDYNADRFIEELVRLVDKNPEQISKVLGYVLEEFMPYHDYEDKLKRLLHSLAEHGLRTEAIAYAEKLRNLKGMLELYTDLVGGSDASPRVDRRQFNLSHAASLDSVG